MSSSTSAENPTRAEWALLGQGLCQLLRDSLHIFSCSALSEGNIVAEFCKLRQSIQVRGVERVIPRVLKGYEFSPADLYGINIDEDLIENVPEQHATSYEWWQWARGQPRGVKFIPMDAKMVNLTIGQKVDERHKDFYAWTANRNYADRLEESSVIVSLVEGIYDYIAITPARTWVDASDSTYGNECLACNAPLWVSIFMVHLDDLDQAMASLQDLASGKSKVYTNPTNGHKFWGWDLDNVDEANMDPSSAPPWGAASFKSMLKIYHEVEEAGVGIHFNPAAPLVLDDYLELNVDGVPVILRVEFKDFNSWKDFLAAIKRDPRSDPFAEKRMWHILYLQFGGKIYCITRDQAQDIRHPTWEWIKSHQVANFREAVAHMANHAILAKQACQKLVHLVRPCDIQATIPDKEIVLSADGLDPHIGHERTQLTLPWARHEVNIQSMLTGQGVTFAFGDGHASVTHCYMEHRWLQMEQNSFRTYGAKLPFQVWEKSALTKRCIPMRFLDLSPRPEVRTDSLTCLRGQWKKRPKEMPYFVILGWKGGDDYLVLESHHTALSSIDDLMPEPSETTRVENFFHCIANSETEMQIPDWPRKQRGCIRFNSPRVLTDQSIRLDGHMFHIKDGSVNRELERILRKGNVSPGGQVAQPSYVLPSVKEILDLTWKYGYERNLRAPQKPVKKEE